MNGFLTKNKEEPMEFQILSLIHANTRLPVTTIARALGEDVNIGRVYVAIERLQARGDITVRIDSEKRRFYSITDQGITTLERRTA